MLLETRCKQLHTEPGMALVLVGGTLQWLNGQDVISHADFPSRYHRLISQQNAIGWRQLFNGRPCTEWARLQDDYVYIESVQRSDAGRQMIGKQRQQTSRVRNGTQWSGEIITVLWAQWYKVWVQRNAVIHGHDQVSRARQQQAMDVHRLQAIYQSRLSTIGYRFMKPLSFKALKHATKRAIQRVRSIKPYFPVRPVRNSQQAGTTPRQNTPQPIAPRHVRRPRTILSYLATGRPPDTR